MDPRTHAAVAWLLNRDEPAIRLMTRRDVLGEPADEDAGQVLAGAKATALLSGRQPDGGFGVHPYRKRTGAHGRAGLPGRAGHSPGRAARGRGCRPRPRLAGQPAPPRPAHQRARPRPRLHRGKRPGRLLRPGLAADPRVRSLAGSLIAWQWPDGGWNCDPAATGRRSSFHESLVPAWGLHEYGQATGGPAARNAASRTAGLFLAHRIGRCF
jgi:hypothetical protein